MEYDYIIIGAGISGLYTAYLIKKNNPNTKILILESNNYIGGRMGIDTFFSTRIVTGAGIGRKNKDINLIKLLNELKITYNEFKVNTIHAKNIDEIDIKKIMKQLKTEYDTNKNIKKPLKFKTFATEILGAKLYKNFLINSGYHDYENEDAYSVLTDYHMEYNTSGWIGLSIPWEQLINKLVDIINIKNIKLKSTVTKVNIFDKEVHVNNNLYLYKKLVFATTISSIEKLLKLPMYKQIKSQPFLRIYAKINSEYIDIIKEKVPKTLIVSTLLYKIIPMNPNKGIYMIGYTDNNGAETLYKNIKNIKYIEEMLAKSIDVPKIEIDKIKHYYWKEGTHYFIPYKFNKTEFINKAQHPKNNVFVVGECISEDQGWTEGAITSVNNIIDKIIKK
jgi:hypothetical protein